MSTPRPRINDCRAPDCQRNSRSGRRADSARGHTPWATARHQDQGAVSAPCPRGRVGTNNYRLAVAVEVAGIKADDSPAAGTDIRADCGTGISRARADTTDT